MLVLFHMLHITINLFFWSLFSDAVSHLKILYFFRKKNLKGTNFYPFSIILEVWDHGSYVV